MNIAPGRQFDTPWVKLTSRQLSLWLEIKISDSPAAHQIGGFTCVKADIEPTLFREAVSLVMASNDALRLRIDPDEPRQRVDTSIVAPLDQWDLSNQKDPEAAFLTRVRLEFAKPLTFDGDPLFRVALARGADSLWFWLIRCHHLIADGLSAPILARRIAEAYDNLVAGRDVGSPSTSPYLKFVETDQAYLNSTRYSRDLRYWKERFNTLPPPLMLPRAPVPRAEGGPNTLVLWSPKRSAYDAFLAACEASRIRPVAALVSLLGLVLTPAGYADDLAIGLAVSGRSKEQKDHVGQFAAVIPLRFRFDENQNVELSARQIADRLASDYRHQKFPVDALSRSLELSRAGRRTVFDVFMSYIPADKSNYDFTLAGVPITPTVLRGAPLVPLALFVTENHRGGQPLFEFAYNNLYVDIGEVEAIRDRLANLLLAFPQIRTGTLHEIAAGRKPAPIAAQPAEVSLSSYSVPADAWNGRIAGTFTIQPILPSLQFWLRKLGVETRLECTGYGQVFQELLEPSSRLRSNPRGFNVVLVRIEDWLRDRLVSEGGAESETDAMFLEEIATSFVQALKSGASGSAARWLVVITPPSPGFDRDGSYRHLQVAAEGIIIEGARNISGLELLHYDNCRALYPVTEEFDAHGDRLGHVPYTSGSFAAMGTFVARHAHRILRLPVKVIAVDCDNTLWRGVVGEEGPSRVTIEDSHRRLQERLVEASSAGVLICLCSKNEWADVEAVFASRPDMVLKLGNVVTSRVNWDSKSRNLLSLAAELDLGLDSFVFLDDNPIEIAEVGANCPGVTAILIPDGDSDRAYFVDHLWLLDHGKATREDTQRTRLYRENMERAALKRSVLDYAGFIESLALKIEFDSPHEFHLERCAQLTERTTQFNINARRLGPSDVQRLRDQSGSALRIVSVRDRFGNYGLVGLMAAERSGTVLEVSTFLMSCRVLGRGVEHAMIVELGHIAQQLGCNALRFRVTQSERNVPVRQFFEMLEADRTANAIETVITMTRDAALANRFRPETNQVRAPNESDASSLPDKTRFVASVAPESWSEIASAFDNVPAIERGIRRAILASRSSQTPYRPPETATELVLSTMLAEALGVDQVGLDDDFLAMGLQSLAAVQLVSRVRNRLGIEMPVRSLFEAPTIVALARLLQNCEGTPGYCAIVPLQLGTLTRPPLFCFHTSLGDTLGYMRLARALGPSQPVYGLQASGLIDGEPLAGSIEEMAAVYLREIRRVQPGGPYHLLGWSFGGTLAYETACRIRALGEEVGLLAFLDAPAPQYKPEAKDVTREDCVRAMNGDLAGFIDEFQLKHDSATKRIKFETIEELVKVAQRLAVVPPEFTVKDAERKIAIYCNCDRVHRHWIAKPYDGPVLHFRATKRRWTMEVPYDWRRWVQGRIEIVEIPCTHLLMGFEPYIGSIAEWLKPLLPATMGQNAAAPCVDTAA